MRIWVATFSLAAACTNSGALDLQLSLPTDPDLRPTGMTSVSVVASSAEIDTLTNTSILDPGSRSFSARDLPVGKGIQIDVLFHDDSNRLVGVGESPTLIDIVGDKKIALAIPVRKPFIYTSSGTKLYSYDPTLDQRAPKFQGTLAGVTAPLFAVSVGGDRLVLASATSLSIIDTATNRVTGSPITIPGTIKDAATIPSSHRIAVAHSTGISIVDLDSGTVTTGGGVSVDRVSVWPTLDGHVVAYGLVARVAPPVGPVDTCTGMSSLILVDVDHPEPAPTPVPLGVAVADLAAAPNTPALFAALPCTGKVSRYDNGGFTDVATLPRAAVLTVSGEKVWAAGTRPATPVCGNNSGTTACTPAALPDCSSTASVQLGYVTTGAALVVESIPLAGGAATEVDVPEPRETMIATNDPARQHAQVLRALSLQPLDLVALPGGQYVSVITANTYFITALGNGTNVILPCLKAITGDWLLMDMASSSVAQRVRTKCDLSVGTPTGSEFPTWICEDAPVGQTPALGEYQPTSVGALFGAR
ncbi:hypothetical protein BH11MYX1_BH11MYX1_22750 [soil metagenome]